MKALTSSLGDKIWLAFVTIKTIIGFLIWTKEARELLSSSRVCHPTPSLFCTLRPSLCLCLPCRVVFSLLIPGLRGLMEECHDKRSGERTSGRLMSGRSRTLHSGNLTAPPLVFVTLNFSLWHETEEAAKIVSSSSSSSFLLFFYFLLIARLNWISHYL